MSRPFRGGGVDEEYKTTKLRTKNQNTEKNKKRERERERERKRSAHADWSESSAGKQRISHQQR